MNNQIQLFKNTEFGELGVIEVEGKPLFPATRCAEILGYSNPHDAISKHCLNLAKHEVENSRGQMIKSNFISEGDLYRLIVRSKLPAAEKFERWVFDEVLPSIRKTGSYSATANSEAQKLKSQQDRARAMLLNAQSRALKTLMNTISDKNLSPIAAEVFGLKCIEEVTGMNVGNLLPKCEITYTATELGSRFGVSANRIGKIANANGLKTDEYGINVMDKSRYSSKEVSNFRYNERGVNRISKLLSSEI